MARYYMFTQVYFNVTGKALELHLNEWLRGERRALGRGARGLPAPRTTSRSGRPCAARTSLARPGGGRARALPRRLRDPRAPARARRRSASRPCCPSCASASAPATCWSPTRPRTPTAWAAAAVLVRRLRRLARAHGGGQPVHPPPVADRPLPRLYAARVEGGGGRRCGSGGSPPQGSEVTSSAELATAARRSQWSKRSAS